MNATDAAMVEQTHRTQARAITRQPAAIHDTRSILRVLCPRCHGTTVIDRYIGNDYRPQQCGCDRGWISVYEQPPVPTTKENHNERTSN